MFNDFILGTIGNEIRNVLLGNEGFQMVVNTNVFREDRLMMSLKLL